VGMMRDHRLTSALAADGNPAGAVAARVVTRGSKTVLTATLALAAASWVIAVVQMNGMDMGVATELGSFGFFAAVWASMMAAMMLPGALPAVLRNARQRFHSGPGSPVLSHLRRPCGGRRQHH